MSEEIQADVADRYMEVRKALEAEINRLLTGVFVEEKADEWAFIAIVLEEGGPDYREIVKRSSRGKVLEFRLKISHDAFSVASPSERMRLIFKALHRSVELMQKVGVTAETRRSLRGVLCDAQKNLGVESAWSDELGETSTETNTGKMQRQQKTAVARTGTQIIKLYKRDAEKDVFYYWEAWNSPKEVTVHWGIVGEEGSTNKLGLTPHETPFSIIEREAAPFRAKGYQELPDDKLSQVVIQYPIVEMGTPEDLDKRYEVEHLMNQRLGWTGLGHCDGGDIGSGTMNVFCFVVDTDKATQCITEELRAHDLLNGARVLLFSEEGEQQLLFPVESLEHRQ